jgi:hypothetical protein
MERIHIVGLGPRTGTTLMAESMIACFDIDAFDDHESQLFTVRRNVETYLSKWPGDVRLVGPRLYLDRHFHVVCMVRDPRDVVTSRHGKDRQRYFAPLRVCKERFREFQSVLGYERFIPVRYEDLVNRPNDIQKSLGARLPFLRAKAEFGNFHLAASPSQGSIQALNGLRPIDSSSVGHWRQNLPRLAGQIARHGSISAELITLGYEENDNWMALLNGVEADMASSHLPETLPRDLGSRIWRLRMSVYAYFQTFELLARRAAGQSVC